MAGRCEESHRNLRYGEGYKTFWRQIIKIWDEKALKLERWKCIRFDALHSFKATARRGAALEENLFGQCHNPQRQASQRGGSTCDSPSGFPVILSGPFHAGIGMHQATLIVIDRYAR